MKFNVEKKRSIILYLLEKIKNGDKSVTKKVSDTFDINQTTVHTYANELIKEGVIIKAGRDKYELVSNMYKYHLERSVGEMEMDDRVYLSVMEPHVKSLSENVRHIWGYTFSEMINNVIDHSGSPSVDILVRQDYLSTSVVISDNGVGIFKKIKEFFGLATLDDAISELFKGKLTTDKENHSGEGIFFSSKMVDFFAIVSDGKVFSNDIFDNSQVQEYKKKSEGTVVIMELSNFSNKVPKEIFDQYADTDNGFFKTVLPIRNIFETEPVSRSQAKRLCNRLESFREVVIDFEGVKWMGQGFAHQLFVVFASGHDGIKLEPINMCEEVESMYKHVINTR